MTVVLALGSPGPGDEDPSEGVDGALRSTFADPPAHAVAKPATSTAQAALETPRITDGISSSITQCHARNAVTANPGGQIQQVVRRVRC
jgi:hypothetical protein